MLFDSKCGTIALIHPETGCFMLVGRLRCPVWQTALEGGGARFMPALLCFHGAFATFVLGKCRGLTRGWWNPLCGSTKWWSVFMWRNCWRTRTFPWDLHEQSGKRDLLHLLSPYILLWDSHMDSKDFQLCLRQHLGMSGWVLKMLLE